MIISVVAMMLRPGDSFRIPTSTLWHRADTVSVDESGVTVRVADGWTTRFGLTDELVTSGV